MALDPLNPVLTFNEVYALKRLLGPEAAIIFENGITVFPLESCANLDELDRERISEYLVAFGVPNITVIGTILKGAFVVHDVVFNCNYLPVPHAANVAVYLRLPFVRHKKMSTKSLRRIKKYKPVELRPLDEFVMENGERLVAFYKGED